MKNKIKKLQSTASNLMSNREKEFLESILAQWEKKGSLSAGQTRWFESIADKYSEESLLEMKEWENSWGSYHRSRAIVVANYYKSNPPYFANCVAEILGNPKDFILTKAQWAKMCENKYAKRILDEFDKPAKFSLGQCVQIRKTHKLVLANKNSQLTHKDYNDMRDTTGFIMEVNAKPIFRAAKGSKVYKILLAGRTRPIYAHESDLKNFRKKKK